MRAATHTDVLLDTQAESLLNILRAKNPETHDHSVRVAEISRKIAQRMAINEEQLHCLSIAAVLHDVGKITIPTHLLTKAHGLSSHEFFQMKNHARMGQVLLSRFHHFETIAQAVRYHHERWDGEGYPDGLAGVEIPLLSRIIHVADSVDAMLHPRTYKSAYPMEWVLGELNRCRGSQFDPHLVDVVSEWIEGEMRRPARPARAA